MSVPLRRVVVALAGGLLASGGLAVVAAPADGAAAGACTDASGVTVVVDFGSLGGGVQVRCAPAPVANGFDALTRAGFAITSVNGQAFLCRVDGQPADEPCNHIPGASRYWSYWHADRGDPWTYSTSGASRKPPPGSVEGWAFGAGTEPGVAPPGPITTTTSRPATPPTSAPPTTTGGVGVTVPGSSTTVGSPDSTGPSTTSPSATTPPSTTRPAGASDGAADDDADEGAAADLTSAVSSGSDGGSPVGLVVAGGLIVGLGGVGLRTARRRSRDAEADG